MSERDDRIAVLRARQDWYLTDDAMQGLVLREQLTNHHRGACPGCGVEGWFCRGWFGRRHHPACGARWVESPWTWALNYGRQWRELIFEGLLDPTIGHMHGCWGTLGCSCLGAVLAVPLLLLLWPLQIVIGWRARGAAAPRPATPSRTAAPPQCD